MRSATLRLAALAAVLLVLCAAASAAAHGGAHRRGPHHPRPEGHHHREHAAAAPAAAEETPLNADGTLALEAALQPPVDDDVVPFGRVRPVNHEGNVFEETWEKVQQGAADALNTVEQGATDALHNVEQGASDAWDAVSDEFQHVEHGVEDAWNTVSTTVQSEVHTAEHHVGGWVHRLRVALHNDYLFYALMALLTVAFVLIVAVMIGACCRACCRRQRRSVHTHSGYDIVTQSDNEEGSDSELDLDAYESNVPASRRLVVSYRAPVRAVPAPAVPQYAAPRVSYNPMYAAPVLK